MRSRWVVVLDELGEHALKMVLIFDEQSVETFSSRAVNESLGERVGARRANWRLDDPGANRGDHLIEGPDGLGSSISDQELDDAPLVLERHREIARLWVTQLLIGCSVTPAKKTLWRSRRNCDQVGPNRRGAGLRRCRRSTFDTLVTETVAPSFFNSPTIRR
jgi:hypothetical protein